MFFKIPYSIFINLIAITLRVPLLSILKSYNLVVNSLNSTRSLSI